MRPASLALSLSVAAFLGAMVGAQDPDHSPTAPAPAAAAVAPSASGPGAGTRRRPRTRRHDARSGARSRTSVRRGGDCPGETRLRTAVRFLSRARRARSCGRTRSGPLAGRPRRHRGQGAVRLSSRRPSGTRDAGVPRPHRSGNRGHRRVPARAAGGRQESRARPTRWPRSSATPRPEPSTSTDQAAARRVIRSQGTSPASARNTTRPHCRAAS